MELAGTKYNLAVLILINTVSVPALLATEEVEEIVLDVEELILISLVKYAQSIILSTKEAIVSGELNFVLLLMKIWELV